jgi:predicted PurR-regulated permease PerM
MHQKMLPLKTHTQRPLAASGRATLGEGRFYSIRGIVLVLLAVLVLWLNSGFIKPIVVGAIFAIVLFPFMPRLEKYIASQGLRAALITAAFAIAFLIPLGFIVYLAADSLIQNVQSLSAMESKSSVQMSIPGAIDFLGLNGMLQKVLEISPVTQAQLMQGIARLATASGAFLLGVSQGLITSLPSILFANLIILMTVFFLLIDGPKAAEFIRRNSIFGLRDTDHLFAAVASLSYGTLVATILTSLVQAGLVAIACIVTGVGNVVLIFLVALLFSILPLVGTVPVTLSLAIFEFCSGSVSGGVIFLVTIAIIAIADNLIRPYVLKGGTELHPLIAFVSAFGALDVIGFYGLFIGPVVAGLFFALLPMVTQSYSRARRLK